jgi:ribonuclease PH
VIGPAKEVVTDSVAAISVGLVDGEERLDLEYVEDRDADVDMNLVMTGSGRFIEVQGAGEEATFSADQLLRLIQLGTAGVAEVTRLQRAALGDAWPG